MKTYFERYAYPKTLFKTTPNPGLKISVVIPCFNEPNIIPTLDSLNNCDPVEHTEVIVIVNEPERCEKSIQNANRNTLNQIDKWRDSKELNFELLVYHFIAPVKHAGVGLARKIGMDEAARRFEQIGNPKGVICCFDADSTCDPSYLQSIADHFYIGVESIVGASIYYEHAVSSDPIEQAAIVQYELHLRYYVNALRLIEYPFAHQTVGSSMAVRSDAYQQIGGMNKRKAGEDFYFLHRLMPSGKFIDINDTTVHPSPRESDRVPFGTGRAIGQWKQNKQEVYMTYNLDIFLDLDKLFAIRLLFYKVNSAAGEKLISSLPDSIRIYLANNGFEKVLARINRQSTSVEAFEKNWFAFFDGFRVLKYVHFARDSFYPNQPIAKEAEQLLLKRWPEENDVSPTPENLLRFYRSKDRHPSGG